VHEPFSAQSNSHKLSKLADGFRFIVRCEAACNRRFFAREVVRVFEGDLHFVFWFCVSGLIPSDVKTLSDFRTDVNTIAYFVLLLS